MGIAVDGDRRRAMTCARWAKVLKFTVADVDANARGRLSGRQRLRCAGTGVIAFAITVAAAERAFRIAHMPAGRGLWPASSLVLGFVAAGAVSLGAAWFASVFLHDAVAGRAAVAIGRLQYVWRVGPRGNVTRYLSCDGRHFDMRAPCRDAIDEEVIYRVYYAACSERLLSLEPCPRDPRERGQAE